MKAADWRLHLKRTYLKMRIDEPEAILSAGIAMALGYKHNAEPFLELFLRMRLYTGLDEQEYFARLLGLCGFFNERFSRKWQSLEIYKLLQGLYDKFAHDNPPDPTKLILSQVRPFTTYQASFLHG